MSLQVNKNKVILKTMADTYAIYGHIRKYQTCSKYEYYPFCQV